jgi:broad specificity phosphatase PhoE
VSSGKVPQREFLFLRHGETRFNAEKRFQGRIDVPLNENGNTQARKAARILASHTFSKIISSPAIRATETAEWVAQAHGTEVLIEPDLREFFVGSLEGELISQALAGHGLGPHDSWMEILPGDADRWEDFKPRVCEAVTRWTEHFADETLLFASHGLVFRALTESLLGEPVMSGNAEPHYFKLAKFGWALTTLD